MCPGDQCVSGQTLDRGTAPATKRRAKYFSSRSCNVEQGWAARQQCSTAAPSQHMAAVNDGLTHRRLSRYSWLPRRQPARADESAVTTRHARRVALTEQVRPSSQEAWRRAQTATTAPPRRGSPAPTIRPEFGSRRTAWQPPKNTLGPLKRAMTIPSRFVGSAPGST
jgi:hypothetical protein